MLRSIMEIEEHNAFKMQYWIWIGLKDRVKRGLVRELNLGWRLF